MDVVADAQDCIHFAHRLLKSLSAPFTVGSGQSVQISASVGIAIYPDHGRGDELLVRADAAMYAAKRAGRANFALFEPHMIAGAREQLSLQTELHQAVALGQLQLYYQPKLDSVTNAITGVEALIRWNHPVHGLVEPDAFIPIAERCGLIRALGDWVITEACRQMRAWLDQGLHMPVAINVSPWQFREAGLVGHIQRALQRHALLPSQLLCEITESASMDDVAGTQQVFKEMAQAGVFLSIDDFGTGYSNLGSLRRLPVRQLKIDRSFVSNLEANPDTRAIVDAVIHLAHALDLRVVAEGVETSAERDVLCSLRCDELQGYFFAKPMPADALVVWVKQHHTGTPAGRTAVVELSTVSQ